MNQRDWGSAWTGPESRSNRDRPCAHLKNWWKANSMNILDKIVEHKRVEVLESKQKRPLSSLNASPLYRRRSNVISLSPEAGKPAIIAEFKRRSPSRGVINMEADPVLVAGAYEAAGVSAMSILTDHKFFGGSLRDLQRVRESKPDLVLLRKDFIIEPYQLHEASAFGADMVLLIAAILERHELEELALEAVSLGLNVLFEVHDARELEKHHPAIKYVGVNNRDLKTFQVDTRRSLELIQQMP
ncbi:MAG: indole-3-glycerol-phosphate synthase, partial [Bacteroidia bacterium]